MENNSTANQIFQQLGGGRFAAMVGMKNAVHGKNFLMFSIGLEFSLPKLFAMKRIVFAALVALSAALLTSCSKDAANPVAPVLGDTLVQRARGAAPGA